jgi:HD-like signal output (HDOD) protein
MTAELTLRCVSSVAPPATPVSLDAVRAKLERLDRMPSIPAILLPLIRNLELPVENVDVQKVVDLISYDESIAAQCLHMANSPLFGRWQDVGTVRGAVVALGIARVRDIAMSCCVLKLLPDECGCIDPRTFWEHSLGVAMVSRRLARRIGFKEAEKAYLAGLLHDLGIIANLLLLPDAYQAAAHHALSNKIPFDEAESELLGFTHCLTGMMLADHWRLAPGLSDTVHYHHDPERATTDRALTAIVHLADTVCRTCGLGYGYNETKKLDLVTSPAWPILAAEHPPVRALGAARFASEMDMYASEVRRLVSVLFRFER